MIFLFLNYTLNWETRPNRIIEGQSIEGLDPLRYHLDERKAEFITIGT